MTLPDTARLRGRVPLTEAQVNALNRGPFPDDLTMLCRAPGCTYELEVSEEDSDASQSEFVNHAHRRHPEQPWQDVLVSALLVRGAVG